VKISCLAIFHWQLFISLATFFSETLLRPHKQNNDLFGELIRLNLKRATIKINEQSQWLVHYSHLFRVIEGETGDLHEQTFIPRNL